MVNVKIFSILDENALMTLFPSLGSFIISSQNVAVFFSFFSCFLFSTLTRVNLCAERERERERERDVWYKQ